MKKCTNNRTMSFRRLLSLLLGLVLFMELLPGGLTVVGDASDAVTVRPRYAGGRQRDG